MGKRAASVAVALATQVSLYGYFLVRFGKHAVLPVVLFGVVTLAASIAGFSRRSRRRDVQ